MRAKFLFLPTRYFNFAFVFNYVYPKNNASEILKNRLAIFLQKQIFLTKKKAYIWRSVLLDVLKMKSLWVNWNQHICTSYKEVNVFIAEYKTFEETKFEQLQKDMKIFLLSMLYRFKKIAVHNRYLLANLDQSRSAVWTVLIYVSGAYYSLRPKLVAIKLIAHGIRRLDLTAL